MWDRLLNTEPALLIGAIMSLIVLAVSFGAPIAQDQVVSIEETLKQVVPLILAIMSSAAVTRQRVFAPATVEKEVAKAAITQQVPEDLKPPAGTVGA